MRRVIDGRTYDTQTSTLIATSRSECPVDSPAGYADALYLSDWRGGFYLVGKGGPKSPYPPGEELHPIEAFEAEAWLRNSGAFEALEVWFGPEGPFRPWALLG